MADDKRIYINMVECKGCMGCADINPDCIDWDDKTELPIVKKDCMSEEDAHELAALCPADCIEYEDE